MEIPLSLYAILIGDVELELQPTPYVMAAYERLTFVGIIQEWKAPHFILKFLGK